MSWWTKILTDKNINDIIQIAKMGDKIVAVLCPGDYFNFMTWVPAKSGIIHICCHASYDPMLLRIDIEDQLN